MSESYRHFYLYAKGWYARSDNIIEDLKHLVGDRCMLDIQYITKRDVIMVLSHAAMPYIAFDRFINHLMDKEWLYSSKSTLDNLVDSMLYVLMQATINEIPFELGDPNPKILPLKNYNKEE